MNLAQWASLGDIAAAMAVIVSLVYVARQLKQNTNAMIVNNADNFVDMNARMIVPVAADRAFSELWVKAASDFESLDAIDRQRMIIWEFQAITAFSNWFNLREQGLISDIQWSELESTFTAFGQRQSMRETWKIFKKRFCNLSITCSPTMK